MARSNLRKWTVYSWTNTARQPAARARARVRMLLEDLAAPSEIAENVILATSELVANATEHATGPYVLRLLSYREATILECRDRGPKMPVPPLSRAATDATESSLDERGRGLLIVQRLFNDNLSIRETARGKAVSVVFAAVPATNR